MSLLSLLSNQNTAASVNEIFSLTKIMMCDTAADLPEHTFVKKVICGKSGKTKGQNQFSSTLVIGPHTFKHRNNYKENYYFSCTDCMKQKKTVNAIAHCILGETPDKDEYELQFAQPIDAHVCH